MKTIKTSIVIQASAEQVWTILTNLDAYVDWNPFIVLAKGDLVVGQPFQLRRAGDVTGGAGDAVVSTIDTHDHTLSWTTWWINSSLLKIEHSFMIEAIDADFIRFLQHETLSGLIPLIWQSGRLDNRQSYMESMNKALKQTAENRKYRLPVSWRNTV
ncbi:MAG: SRPBCC domain-containing protein [Anaerolineae bacterium]